eukprot:scaffold125891_cov18-Phaeocystis_antarctica.AAC.1
MTDPILSKKLVDDRLANRTNSSSALTYEQAMDESNYDPAFSSSSQATLGSNYDPASVQMLGR